MTDNWENEKTRRTQLHAESLQNSLIAAKEFVVRQSDTPLALRNDMPSLIYLLSQAQSDIFYLQNYLSLIQVLDPLPQFFGYYSEWLKQMEYLDTTLSHMESHHLAAFYKLRRAQMLHFFGQNLDATEMAEQVAVVAMDFSDIDLFIRAIGLQFIIKLNVDVDIATASALLAGGEDVADFKLNPAAATQLSILKATLFRRQGFLPAALEQAEMAVHWASSGATMDLSRRAEAFRMRALSNWAVGNDVDAIPDYERAIELFLKAGDLPSLQRTQSNLGLVYWSMGELDAAEDLINRAIESAMTFRRQEFVASRIGDLGLVALARGRLIEAERLIVEQLAIADDLQTKHESNRAKGNLALVFTYAGKYTEALDLLEYERRLMDSQQLQNEGTINSHVHMGYCYLGLGYSDKALSYAHDSLKMSETVGSESLKVVCLRFLAECLPPLEAVDLLYHALSKVVSRRLSKVACLVSIAMRTNNHSLWETAKDHLLEMGAYSWISGRSIDDQQPLWILNSI